MSLYAHQESIIKEDPKWSGLWLGTGSGKTRTALLLARGDTLIICPKTQKEDGNWPREMKKIIDEGLGHIYGDRPVGLTVVSKEEFRRDWQKLSVSFDTVIVDEAHTCLGVTPDVRFVKKVAYPKTSQLFEALNLYVKKIKPERLYLLSATITKSPLTVWGAATILGKNWDYFGFRQTFYFQLPRPGRTIWMVKQDHQLKVRLADNIKKLGYVGQLSDYFDVPEQTFKTIYLEPTPEQKQALKDAKIDFPDPLVLPGKKHQIENGLLLGDEFNALKTLKNPKLDTIKELAYEFPKMVIFARYTAQIEAIKEMLHKEYNVLILDGRTKDKGEVISAAENAQNGCILLVQSQVSAGWEIPSFPVMVFASLSRSYVDRVQAEGRILRANFLKKNLYIDLVMKGGVDEACFNAIKSGKDFDEIVYAKK